MKKTKIISMAIALSAVLTVTSTPSYAMPVQHTLSNPEITSSLIEQLTEKTNKRTIKNITSNILVDKILMTSTSYDLREHMNITVYDQGETNTCWANSTNSALEITMEKLNNETLKLSRRHLVYSVLSPMEAYGYGAWFEDAAAYYTSGKGPVLESTMPWADNENTITTEEQEILNNTSSIKQVSGWEKITPVYKYIENGTVKYTKYDYTSYKYDGEEYQNDWYADLDSIEYVDDSYVSQARQNIKNCIMQYGAIFTTIDCDADEYDSELSVDTLAFNKNSNIMSEYGYHAVCIIGWDDDYAISNFPQSSRPSKPGAYLILNSWGSESHENGCLWISYEDIFVERELSVFTGIKNVEYDTIYQYDDTGVASAVYRTDVTSVYGANIFTREATDKIEKLTEVGITNVYDASYEIYVNSTDGEISSDKMQKVATINSARAGYNTVKLETPVELTGDKFVVAVKYIYNSNNALIGIEEPSSWGINTGYRFSSYNENATSSSGQSYIGTSLDSMKDLTGSDTGFTGYTTYEELDKANVPIKAFTNLEDEDNTAPEITKISISSTNENNQYATIGDTINVTINTNEKLEVLPTVKICNTNCTVEEESEKQYKASIKVTNKMAEGEVSINISGYKDAAGNQGVEKNSTTDNTKVIIDTKLPTIKLANAQKEGEIILLTLEITDENMKEINITEENVIVKIGEKTVQPETKTITEQKEIENGKQYTIKIQGIEEEGKLSIEIESGIAKDYSNQTNEKTTISTEINISTKIESNVYTISEKNIKNISEKTSVQNFLTNIQNSTDAKIYEKNNEEATSESIIKTGMKLKSGTTEYTLIVVYDVNGDGNITSTDLSKLVEHILGQKLLEDEYEQAGDINFDENITSTDLSKMKAYLVK